MANNVSTEGLNGVALEIANNINSLKNSINNLKENNNNIKIECEKLKDYNNQRVSGSSSLEKKYEVVDNLPQYKHTIETYKIWQIEGQEGLEETCITLEQQLEDLNDSLYLFKLESNDIELIADTIDSYIVSIQEELGEDIDQTALASAFGTLSTGIAFNSYNASTGNFVSTKHLLEEYWTDKALKFVKNADGTYTIYQKDENGKEIAMGYTTALTAALYMKNLKNSINTHNNNNNNSNLRYEQAPKTITTDQLNENVKKEIMEYAKVDTDITASDFAKEEAYNKLSNEAKDLVDGNTKVLNIENDFKEIVDKGKNLVIPDDKTLYVNGRPVDSKILIYDKETSKYRNKDVALTDPDDYFGYTKEDLYENSELK